MLRCLPVVLTLALAACRGSEPPRLAIGAAAPDFSLLPPGCRFHTRCEYTVPGRCDDLAGIAKSFVTCSELDPLRDEAIDYATRLLRAGVATALHVIPGTCHGFDSYLPDWDVSQDLFALQGRVRADQAGMCGKCEANDEQACDEAADHRSSVMGEKCGAQA